MEEPRKPRHNGLKHPFLLITYAILLFILLYRFEEVWTGLLWLLNIASPLFFAFVLAFIFHLPMNFFQFKVLKSFENHKSKFLRKIWRGASMMLAYASVLAFVIGIIALIFQPVTESLTTLATNFSSYLKSFQVWADGFLSSMSINPALSETITEAWQQAITLLQSLIGRVVSGVFNFTVSLTTGVFNFVLSFILSAFMLYYRGAEFKQIRKLSAALIGSKRTQAVAEVFQLADNIFSKFVFGQIVEALILGVLCFIGMTIFKMNYALLISTIIGVTAIIPILGAYIGTVPCALILLVIDPMQAVWFLVFIVILQQLEGDFIYPHTVGNAIGLNGLWVLASLLVGGGLFGIWGMLLGVPLCAVLHRLVDRWVDNAPRDLE